MQAYKFDPFSLSSDASMDQVFLNSPETKIFVSV